MRKITIVHLITSLDMGGAERMLSNLVLHMDRSKFTNIVISLKDLGYWGRFLRQHDIAVYHLDMRPNFGSLLKLGKLWSMLRKIKPDYLQGWMYHANILALCIGKFAGIEQILWNIRCSNMDLSKYRFTTRITFKLGAWLSKAPYAIINNSKASMQQHSEKGYKNNRLLYVPNGFDLDKFKPDPKAYSDFRRQHGLATDAKLIGMFARFDPMKDHVSFFKAAGILAAKHPKVYFVLAGKGLNTDNLVVRRLIKENNLASRVVLLGQVQDMHKIFPAMDYVTQTSVFGEGFPNVIGEAMACGVPCFCTNVGDSLEVIGDTGVKIAAQDPEGLAVLWDKVLNSRDESFMGQQRVRAWISENYSIERISQQYAEIYIL